ncbi:MAG TPA: hypothetical protein VNH11_00080 [Pirellulales bacterium]|nr:hypothetical protein [Pirellulales bacterium]
MIFADIPKGASLFIDANTFVYHFTPHPVFKAACTDLCDRVEHGDVHGFASTHVMTDVAHRLMTTEAIHRNGWPAAGIAQRLEKCPGNQKLDPLSASGGRDSTVRRADSRTASLCGFCRSGDQPTILPPQWRRADSSDDAAIRTFIDRQSRC